MSDAIEEVAKRLRTAGETRQSCPPIRDLIDATIAPGDVVDAKIERLGQVRATFGP